MAFITWNYITLWSILKFLLLVVLLLRKLKQQGKEQMEERRPKLIQALKQMGDFYLQLKWDFQSWGKGN